EGDLPAVPTASTAKSESSADTDSSIVCDRLTSGSIRRTTCTARECDRPPCCHKTMESRSTVFQGRDSYAVPEFNLVSQWIQQDHTLPHDVSIFDNLGGSAHSPGGLPLPHGHQ